MGFDFKLSNLECLVHSAGRISQKGDKVVLFYRDYDDALQLRHNLSNLITPNDRTEIQCG